MSDVAGGKNLFNNAQELSVGIYMSSGELNSSYHHKVVKVKPNTQYAVSSSEAFSSGYYLTYMNGNQFIDSKSNLANGGYYYTITTPDNCDNIWIYNYNNKNLQIEEGTQATDYEPYIPSVKTLTADVADIKNDLDKLNSLPIGSIIQIEAEKDNIETTKQKYGWQYLGTSNIEYENGATAILVTNVYRKNN